MTTASRIIGALMGAEGKSNPYPIYRQARELGSVTQIAPNWFLVSTYAEVREAMRCSAYLKNRYSSVDEGQRAVRRAHRSIQLFDESVLLKDPPEHGRVRKVLSAAFTPTRIAAMEGKVQQVTDQLLDMLAERASAGEAVDFMEDFAVRLPLTVMCDLMGVPRKDWSRFRPLAEDLNAALEMTVDDAPLAAADAAAAELDDYFNALIEVRRADPQDDLISILIAEVDGEAGQLDQRELLANLVLLLVAGFETTTNLLGNALAVLFDHPEVREGLLTGKYTYSEFIEEVLRFDPPVQHMIRSAGEPGMKLAGVPIPLGAELVMLIGSANRDPLRFPNPDVFNPARSDNQHLSFGGGAHYCIAAGLARLEGITAFSRLLARYPCITLAGTPIRASRSQLRGFRELPVTHLEFATAGRQNAMPQTNEIDPLMTHSVPVPRGLPMERDAGPFDPPRRVSQLRDVRPVSPMLFPDGHEGWLVTGYEAVRQLLADTRFSSRRDLGVLHLPYETPGMPAATGPSPQIPGLFVGMDPPEHTRLRRTLMAAFSVRRMKQIEHQIFDTTDRQLDELAQLTPPVDLVTAFALPVASIVICNLLGVPYEDRATFQASSHTFLDQESSHKAKMSAYAALSMYFAELVTRKRAAPGDDILSDLARRDDLTIEELTGMGFLLLHAGLHSTANTLALSIFAILQHPQQLAELRADPDQLPGAVEELLRYISQADIFMRYATGDIELCGETIGKGSTVVVSLRAANRDPLRFENPAVLDIHRTVRSHLSFGHGVHYCLGHQLARIEMCAGLGRLLRRFPSLTLAVPIDDVRFTTDMTNHALRELPVTWEDGPV